MNIQANENDRPVVIAHAYIVNMNSQTATPPNKQVIVVAVGFDDATDAAMRRYGGEGYAIVNVGKVGHTAMSTSLCLSHRNSDTCEVVLL